LKFDRTIGAQTRAGFWICSPLNLLPVNQCGGLDKQEAIRGAMLREGKTGPVNRPAAEEKKNTLRPLVWRI
jgi:hypothetical protein